MSIDCITVEKYLHDHIPLSQSMAVSVVSISDNIVVLAAPLLPNINHRSTVFGGSISAVAILSAWTFTYVQLQHLAIACRIVIKSNHMEYVNPITGDFEAHCFAPPQQSWERFLKTLARRGKGRIILTAEVYSGTLLAGQFEGEYVAINREMFT